MRSLFGLVLFVTLCASTSVNLPVIDLYPIILGFDAIPHPAGDQGIWLEHSTFSIDLDKVDLPKNHLWEGTVFAQPTTGVQPCEWSISYMVDGNQHVVRKGAVTSDAQDYTYYHPSSSILWLRGQEVDDEATEIVFDIRGCSLARYLTRWEFEAWNGEAYLMDWSGGTWIPSGYADEVERWGDLDYASGEGEFPMQRDSTIVEPGVGWWAYEFYFDYQPFLELERPVLEVMLYSKFDDEIYFDFYDTEDDTNWGTSNYMDWNQYQDYTTHYLHFYFDIKSALDEDDIDSDEYDAMYLYFDNTDYSTVFPYARIWNFDNGTVTQAPFLMDASSTHAAYTGDCYFDDDTSTYSYNLQMEGYGFFVWNCYGETGTIVTWTLPDGIENVENPWMSWFEYTESTYDYTWGYQLELDDEIIYEGKIFAPYEYEVLGWDRQIALGDYTHNHHERMTVRSTAYLMNFQSAVPVHAGVHNYCKDEPCQNGGACHTYYHDYICICPIGWEGKDCEISTDDCHMNSCLNGGECVDEWMNYSCNCTEAWTGHRCEMRVDSCPQEHCLNGGMCVSEGVYNRWSCDCTDTGFSGRFCENDDNNCHLDPYACENGGVCVSGPGNTYECECPDGWEGEWCEKSSICHWSPCHNEGECVVNEDNEAVCLCTGTYFGEFCDLSIEEFVGSCGGAQCMNGGVCQALEDGTYGCDCLDPSYTGQFCELPVVCLEQNDPCENNGECVRGNDGSAKCLCPPPFVGENCEENFMEVLMQSYAEMAEDCRFGMGCDQGECTQQTDGTFACECDDDFYGDYCDEPLVCNPDPCKNDGMCVRGSEGQAVCICAAGFGGQYCDSELMEAVSSSFLVLNADCRFNLDCENGGECTEQTDGSYACECTDEFTGETCEEPTACTPNPCGDWGICDYSDGEVTCYCSSNRFGENCEYDVEDFFVPDCRFAGCENDGECLHQTGDDEDTYVCSCSENWVGDWCETPANCDPNPCGTGDCVWHADNSSYSCVCNGDDYGLNCERNALADRLDALDAMLADFLSSAPGLGFPLALLVALALRFF